MNEPIFRYIVVLLAVIVMIRIVLSLNFNKKQEDKTQPDETVNESEKEVDQTETANITHEVREDHKIEDSKVQEDDNE